MRWWNKKRSEERARRRWRQERLSELGFETRRWKEYTRRIARDAKIRLHAAETGIPIMSTNAAHSILFG